MTTFAESIAENGFSILSHKIDSSVILDLESSLQNLETNAPVKTRNGAAYGIRNLLNLCPAVRRLAQDQHIKPIAETVLGPGARVVRAIYFDKLPAANWKVVWHQDLTITVAKKIDVDGFTAWSTKARIVHVQPPVSVLESILTLRISLDDSDESNGGLRVIPGSHRTGRLNDFQITEWKKSTRPVVCAVERGGILAMRPLLLHSSSASTNAEHRRVVHLEFSASDLPEGLEWFGS